MPKNIHIWFGDTRTSVSIDDIYFELLAFRLKVEPDDPAAHSVVREWLQDKLVVELGDMPGRKGASQWAKHFIVEEIADWRLMRKRDAWLE